MDLNTDYLRILFSYMSKNTQKNIHYPLLLFWISCVLFGLSTSIFDALYVLHLRALSFGQDKIGLIFSAGFMVMAITLVVMVSNVVKLSAGYLLKASTGLFAICMIIFPYIDTYIAHIIIFAICSVASAIMLSTETAAMLEYIDPEKQLEFFSRFFLIFLLSSGIGTLAIAIVELNREEARGIALFSNSLLIAGGLAMGMALLRFFIRFTSFTQNTSPSLQKHSLIQPHYICTLLIAFFIGASSVLSIRFINLLLVERLHLDIDQALIWLSIERIVCFISLAIYTWKIKFLNNNVASIILLLLSGCFLSMAAFITIPFIFGILYLMRQAAYYTQIPILEHVSFEGVPVQTRAQAGFVRQLGLFLGGAVGAICYGELFAQNEYGIAILLAGAFSIIAAGIFLLRAKGFFKPFIL